MKRRKARYGKFDKENLPAQKQEVQSEKEQLQKGIKEKKWIDKISKYYKMVAAVEAAVIVQYPIVNHIFNMLYQQECENFYLIPGKYFKKTIDKGMLYTGIILMIVTMCLIPIYLRKYTEKRGEGSRETLGYGIVLSMLLGLLVGNVSLYSLILIINKFIHTNGAFEFLSKFFNRHALLVVCVLIVISYISIVGIFLYDVIYKIKAKWLKSILSFGVLASITVCGVLLVCGTVFKTTIPIKEKLDYEIFKSKGNEYIVLSEYQDKLLVVNYKEEYPCTLFTDDYMLLDKCNGTYSYVIMETAPLVESDRYLTPNRK